VRGLFRSVAVAVVLLTGTSPVMACPLCESETGGRVRTGIFDADFGYNLTVTLLPFSVFLAIVALIHLGPPWASTSPRRDHAPRRNGGGTLVGSAGEDQSWATG